MMVWFKIYEKICLFSVGKILLRYRRLCTRIVKAPNKCNLEESRCGLLLPHLSSLSLLVVSGCTEVINSNWSIKIWKDSEFTRLLRLCCKAYEQMTPVKKKTTIRVTMQLVFQYGGRWKSDSPTTCFHWIIFLETHYTLQFGIHNVWIYFSLQS